MKKKVLFITGTRAEYGLLKPVYSAMKKSAKLQPSFLVTGMHTLRRFGNTIDVIRKDGVQIDAVVPVGERDDMLTALGKEVMGIGKYCSRARPEMIIVLGDRDEALAGALAGAHLGIPVAHINGGDVSGAGVDELLRHAITKLAQLHFVSNQANGERVKKMGEDGARIFNVGSTALDGIEKNKLPNKIALAQKYALPPNEKWILVLHHPTPLDTTPLARQIKPLLTELAKIAAHKIVIYPNFDTGADIFIKELELFAKQDKNTHLHKNLPREDFLTFMSTANFMIGNSSAGIIESTLFHLPTVNIGNRQKGRAAAKNIIHTGYEALGIARLIRKALSSDFKKTAAYAESLYGTGGASAKIARVIEHNISRRDLFFK